MSSMTTIQGIPRHQMQFSSLDDFIGTENTVRIIHFRFLV